MTWGAEAPRFHALWQHKAQRSVISMARAEWDRLSQNSTGPVRIDLRETPLGSISSAASIIASVAYQPSDSPIGEIEIYRYDPADEPTPVNLDRYAVLTDIASDPRLPSLIKQAATEDNENMRRYPQDNVFLVKRNPGRDHWATEIPATVAGLYRRNSSS